jgi:hypothetical protein
MRYQDKEDSGSLRSGWNQIINSLVLWAPALFGCRRVSLKTVVTAKDFENLSVALQKNGAEKIAEGHDPTGKSLHHYFRVERRPIILILQEPHPVELIAPAPIVEYVENELKTTKLS